VLQGSLPDCHRIRDETLLFGKADSEIIATVQTPRSHGSARFTPNRGKNAGVRAA
jgi:hypothetical protein